MANIDNLHEDTACDDVKVDKSTYRRAIKQCIGELEAENVALKASLESSNKLITRQSEAILELTNERCRFRDALNDALNIAEDTPELNMGNYGEDEVDNLNEGIVSVYNIIKNALKEPPKQ